VIDPLIAVRAVHFAATLALAGTVIFGAVVADAKVGAAVRERLLAIAWLAFAMALLAGAAWLVVVASRQGGLSIASWQSALFDTTLGHASLVRLVPGTLLAAALLFISAQRADRWRWMVAAAFAVAFTLGLVHSGHAAPPRGWFGTLHRAADGLHLIAAAAWLGGLVPLALLLALAWRGTIPLACARDATLRFSVLGMISVGTLVITGSVNGMILVGSMPALIGTDYGRLLLLKVALFVAMVAIAAVNRLRLMPRLVRADINALRPLMRNAAIETLIGIAILLIVGVLGTLPPAEELHLR
jgi:copper resistance protein D